MGLTCFGCGTRFYLPPGEQVWLEKHCGGSITKPGLPQVAQAAHSPHCACVSMRRQTRSSPLKINIHKLTILQLAQYCLNCMERRFSRPVSKANQKMSQDGSMRMPSGEKEYVSSYAQEPIAFVGERLKTPVAQLGSDCAGIQFQRLKPGRTFFGRISEELGKVRIMCV